MTLFPDPSRFWCGELFEEPTTPLNSLARDIFSLPYLKDKWKEILTSDQNHFFLHSRLLFPCISTRHVPSSYSLLTWQPEVKPLVENTAFMSEVWPSWRPLWVADITWLTRDLAPFSFPDFKWSRLGCSRINHKCYKLVSYLVSGPQSNLIWYATTYRQKYCQTLSVRSWTINESWQRSVSYLQ